MDILLINQNPVVSRLLKLCTRDEHYSLEEASSAEDAQKKEYDVLFVDEESYIDSTESMLQNIEASTKVLFGAQIPQHNTLFDKVIKKPFLPSQVLEVIEGVRSTEEGGSEEQKVAEEKECGTIFPLSSEKEDELVPNHDENREKDQNTLPLLDDTVLDSKEIERIKSLLDMDEEEELTEEELSPEEYELRKIEAIKEELISQGLEIVDEEELDEAFGVKVDLVQEIEEEIKTRKKKHSPTLSDLEKLEMMFSYTIRNMKAKKIRKLLNGKKVKLKLKDFNS